jgi:thiamine-phosphate pyrophosphorylase
MTDERQGDGLWSALDRLPRGAGIVFRHYGLRPGERRRLFARVRKIAARRRLVLLAAGAQTLPADGRHGAPTRRGLASASVHDLRALKAAERGGVHFVFLSPVFATRSHPGGETLGRVRFGLIARQARVPVIALGGVGARTGRSLRALGAYGWAGIDAWTPGRPLHQATPDGCCAAGSAFRHAPGMPRLHPPPRTGEDQKRKAVPI